MKLTDICEFQGGSQPPKNEWSDEPRDGYIRMLQIRDYTQDNSNVEYIKVTNSTKMCEEKDILIARYGASIGKILTGLSGAYNVAMMKVIIDEKRVDRNYIYNFFKSNIFQRYIKNVGQRAAQAGFNKEELSKININIPNLDEQRKITQKIDKISEVIAIRKEQINELDKLIKSQFVEMFGDPLINSKKLKTEKLGDICKIYRGASPRPITKYLNGTIPWIKIGDATNGDNIYLNDTKEKVTEEGAKKSRLIKKGSLIFANCGVSLGFARIINFDGCIHDGWLAFEDFENILNPIFLLQSLNFCTEHFRNIAPDGTQPNLNTGIMKEYNQIIPNMEKQNQFVSFVKQVDKQKFEIQKSLKEMQLLQESLMDKYFGEM